MEKQAIQEAIKLLTPELTWLFIQGFLATLIFFIVKDLINNILNYLRLRFSLWGLNTKMKISDKIGYIKDITFKEVVFDVSGEDITIYIPISRFLILTKEVYHNGHGLKESK
jgi:hypothetical protein